MPRNISKVRIPREISLILCRFKVLNSDIIFTDILMSAQNILTCLVNLKSPVLVFDGRPLPAKQGENEQRSR